MIDSPAIAIVVMLWTWHMRCDIQNEAGGVLASGWIRLQGGLTGMQTMFPVLCLPVRALWRFTY